MNNPILLLQERDFSQKINATFQFVRQEFQPLMMALLYIAGPPALAGGIFMGAYQSDIMGMQRAVLANGGQVDAEMIAMMPTVMLTGLLMGMAMLAVTLVVNAYLLLYEAGNRTITPAAVWEQMKGSILPSLGYGIVIVILTFIGTMLFILPGIYMAVAFSLIFMILMRENLSLGASIQRCFELIRGKWWSTFGLLVIVGIIAGLIGYIFQIPSMVVMILSFLQGKGAAEPNTLLNAITGVIGAVGSVLTRSLVVVALGFQYYNLVERRDNASMHNAIDNLGQKPSNPNINNTEEF